MKPTNNGASISDLYFAYDMNNIYFADSLEEKRRLTLYDPEQLSALLKEEINERKADEEEDTQKSHLDTHDRVKILGRMKLGLEELKKKFSDL